MRAIAYRLDSSRYVLYFLYTSFLFEAAFRSNTIGLPRYCSYDAVGQISSSHVLSFLSQYYTPERIVLAGNYFKYGSSNIN